MKVLAKGCPAVYISPKNVLVKGVVVICYKASKNITRIGFKVTEGSIGFPVGKVLDSLADNFSPTDSIKKSKKGYYVKPFTVELTCCHSAELVAHLVTCFGEERSLDLINGCLGHIGIPEIKFTAPIRATERIGGDIGFDHTLTYKDGSVLHLSRTWQGCVVSKVELPVGEK